MLVFLKKKNLNLMSCFNSFFTLKMNIGHLHIVFFLKTWFSGIEDQYCTKKGTCLTIFNNVHCLSYFNSGFLVLIQHAWPNFTHNFESLPNGHLWLKLDDFLNIASPIYRRTINIFCIFEFWLKLYLKLKKVWVPREAS